MICTTDTSKWSAELIEQVTANPNFAQQLNDWQIARKEAGEDMLDWAAFCAHLALIGAPDPGPTPPPEFYVKSCGGFGGIDPKWLFIGAAGVLLLISMRKK